LLFSDDCFLGLRAGPADGKMGVGYWNSRYPVHIEGMAGRIVIDSERCKGCGLCVVVCPNRCISISRQSNSSGYFPATADNTECTGCANCAMICPDAAIRVWRASRIVAADKDDSAASRRMAKEKA